jgi:hypothetical protein
MGERERYSWLKSFKGFDGGVIDLNIKESKNTSFALLTVPLRAIDSAYFFSAKSIVESSISACIGLDQWLNSSKEEHSTTLEYLKK